MAKKRKQKSLKASPQELKKIENTVLRIVRSGEQVLASFDKAAEVITKYDAAQITDYFYKHIKPHIPEKWKRAKEEGKRAQAARLALEVKASAEEETAVAAAQQEVVITKDRVAAFAEARATSNAEFFEAWAKIAGRMHALESENEQLRAEIERLKGLVPTV